MNIDSSGLLALNNGMMNDHLINRTRNSGGANFEELLRRTATTRESSPPGRVPDAAKPPPSPPAVAASPNTAVIDRESKLFEQCVELEIFLVKTLISSMRSTIQKGGLLDEGFAGKMYEDMLYDEYARDFTKNANFGFAEMAYLELTGQRGKVIAKQ